MALQLVPYHNAMRLGQGFNSFTQEICVDNAVVGMTSKDDLKPLIPVDYIGKPASGSALVTSGKEKDVATVLSEDDAVVTQYPSQIVTYSSKFVEKVSDVSNDMNISGSLSIRYGEISGGGGGSYVNTEAFHNSDINFLIQVKVVNQTINVRDQLQFWPLNDAKADEYEQNPSKFTKVYGDSFISGFQEGGTFSAVVSIKAIDSSEKLNIAANAHLALNIGAGSVEAQADVKIAKEKLAKSSEVTITVNWSGGGQLKNSADLWTIDTLQATAARFPDLVAACPQRTHAILTKYDNLRTYMNWKSGHMISPLGYEIAALYTSELLDAYMGFKNIWTDIHKKMSDLDAGVIELIKAPPPKETVRRPQVPKDGKPIDAEGIDWVDGAEIARFEPTFADLDKALQTCRSLMIRIAVENNCITTNPNLAIDIKRPVAYVRPQVFRQLIPIPPPAPNLTTPLVIQTQECGRTDSNSVWWYPRYPTMNNRPVLLPGFNTIDRERSNGNQKMQLSTYMYSADLDKGQIGLDAPGGGVRYNTTLACICVPVNDEGVLGNAYTFTRAATPAPATNNLVTMRSTITFEYPYDVPPNVVAWLASFAHSADAQISISVKVDKVTTTGFDMVVRGDSSFTEVRGNWFAIPQDLKGITVGSSETPWAPGLNETLTPIPDPNKLPNQVQDHVRFLPNTFKRPPKLVGFVSGFALTTKIVNTRMILEFPALTKRGLDWKIRAWGDTQLVGASLVWIAYDY